MKKVNPIEFYVKNENEKYFPQLEDICRKYDVYYKSKSTLRGIFLSFKFKTEEERSAFDEAIEKNIPEIRY